MYRVSIFSIDVDNTITKLGENIMALKSFEEFRKEVIAEVGDDIDQLTTQDIDDLAHYDIMAQFIETNRYPYGYKLPKRFQ